ncbi:hypothetical protein E2562_029609 [Oryza meyeriana var. granulata]|uniref:DUF7731 domain-containing protein n=1 Tax=Oryza meyeriana var. granulata TaxID=110450 RepID=A0A6G1E3X6_9ORYZ|nr:hypothetical protein E2562_029609 [Oryza meyeriana var. granulata]
MRRPSRRVSDWCYICLHFFLLWQKRSSLRTDKNDNGFGLHDVALAQTNLVLGCVDGIMDSFRFYNGASVRDVRFALDRGCGHSGLRGDFDVLQRLGGESGYYYGGGSSIRLAPRGLMTTPAPLLLGAVVAMLLWG